MKKILIPVLCLCVGIAGTIVYFNQQKTPPAPITTAPPIEAAPAADPEPPEPVQVATKPAPPAAEPASVPTPAPTTNPTPSNPESEATVAFRKTIDTLLAPQFAGQKQELFDRLRTSGQMDQVIAELQRRAKENPTNANIPTTLGEAMLNKVRQLHESGADVNEVGILAMQADQSFNTALKLDPSNWEAQFVKYSTMVYWPADAKRDNEAAQKLAGLIDQQETMPQNPHFAQTYIALGNQYQKMGKTDFAEATWRIGLNKFPNDPTLQQKLAH